MSDDLARLQSIIESLVFVSDEPLSAAKIRKVLEGVPGKDVTEALGALVDAHASRPSGFYLAEVAGGYQFRSRPENAEYIRALLNQKPQRLSRPAMETLAVVAYRQPIIKPDIDKVRGTDSGGVLATLMQHRLVKILGRQNAPGKPFIYGTTKEFLEKFGLKDLAGLPTLREIEEVSGQAIAQTPIDMLPGDGQEITAEAAAAEMGVALDAPEGEGSVASADALAEEMEREWGAGGHPVEPAGEPAEPVREDGPPEGWPEAGGDVSPDDGEDGPGEGSS